ncbi:hypothetical protein [Streptomyces sp. TLI_171]|uniref:hypothetical protein n=1 Tax=Streptomyces sp. TLI_171 TaxID=1938859 RepID=UPI000C19DD3F|nr:hypothetical protein [Streptomyces sp. TLI_171]RKE02961.1 hypothetical protein BX266_7565 [Streptomyces sp. TLI_171]
MTDQLTNPETLQDLDAERDKLRYLVEKDHRLSGIVRGRVNEQRRLRLAIGAELLRLAPRGESGPGAALDELAAAVGLPLETARIYRKVARWSGQATCQELDAIDAEVPFTVLRAAVSVPKGLVGEREEVVGRRLNTLLKLARAAQKSGVGVVTEAELRRQLGDDRLQEDDPAPEPAAMADVSVPVADLSLAAARDACASLLRDPAGRTEVFAAVLATPEYRRELIADGRARAAIQQEIKACAAAERDPDDAAMDAAADADPDVVLARWRAVLQRRDHQAAGLLAYDPDEIVARGDEELIDAVLRTVELYGEWGQRLAAAARREAPRAD